MIVALDEKGYYCLDSTHCQIQITDDIHIKSLLCIENSKLINFIYNFLVSESNRVFAQVKTVYLKKLPIVLPKEEALFIEKADFMLQLSEKLAKKIQTFFDRVNANFEIDKWTKKMSLFYQYDFKTFIGELKKKKIKLSLLQQDEWQEYFNIYRQIIAEIRTEIHEVEHEIDTMVYDLYGLTKEEIKIVNT